jgi:hypothetical protein
MVVFGDHGSGRTFDYLRLLSNTCGLAEICQAVLQVAQTYQKERKLTMRSLPDQKTAVRR